MIAKANHRNIQFVFFSGLFFISLLSAVWFELYYLVAVPFASLFFYAGWKHINAVFFLLLFTLPLSTELQLTGTLGTDFPDEVLMLFTSGLFLSYWLSFPASLSKKIIAHPLVIFLLVTLTWTILTVLYSSNPFISIKFLLAKCWYLGAFVLAPLIVFKGKMK